MNWMLLPLRRYAQFEGRSRRLEYWMFMLLNVLVSCVFFVLLLAAGMPLGAMEDPGEAVSLVSGGFMMIVFGLAGLWGLFVFIPSIAVTVRRLHDRDMSGWWYLGLIVASFIPLVNLVATIAFLVIMLLPGTPGPNQFGEDPKQSLGETFA